MNKSLRKWGLIFGLVMATTLAAEAQSRIATVELTDIFEKYWKTKRARLALNDRRTDLKKELDEMQEAHKKLVENFQKLRVEASDQAVSAAEREKRVKALEPKAREAKESEENLRAYVGRGDAELERMTARMMEEVLKEIKDTVAAKGKAGGYALVVDSSAIAASKAPVFLYNNGESDLTKAVIEQLNATAPAEPVEKK